MFTKTPVENGSVVRERPTDGVSNKKLREGAPEILTEAPSIVDIRRAIPDHCFRSSLPTSLYYVAKDLVIMLALYGLIRLIETYTSWYVYCACVPVYWLLQGTMLWAWFVLAHDCGHGSFSRHQRLNDCLGTVMNSTILVPYFPWRLSHRHHHKNTGNIDREEVYFPIREDLVDEDFDPEDVMPLFGLGIGWFYYLLFGYYPNYKSHLNWLTDPIFSEHKAGCVASLTGVAGWLWCLHWYARSYGYPALTVHYGVPLFVFASWIVMVTFLHHNDTGVAWYANDIWNNVKGQLSSIDRDYGWAHTLTHNIGTHQVHHLFTKIPHYHLEEANASFRAAFPHLVRKSEESIIRAYIRIFRVYAKQRIVEKDAKVHLYRNT